MFAKHVSAVTLQLQEDSASSRASHACIQWRVWIGLDSVHDLNWLTGRVSSSNATRGRPAPKQAVSRTAQSAWPLAERVFVLLVLKLLVVIMGRDERLARTLVAGPMGLS